MATRSYIGKQNSDGTIRAIYCHWDGYPNHVGRLLNDHYDEETKVDNLLNLGDLSSLNSTLEETVAYKHDREENNVDARLFESRQDFILFGNGMSAEFWYLFCNGEWETLGRGPGWKLPA